jgi:hypothetical protein
MDTEFHQLIERLSEAQKLALRDLLDRDLAKSAPSNGGETKPREFGWARGLVSIAADFDEPLEDFKDYME